MSADVALTAPGSVEAALKSLDGRISAATVARLREEAAAKTGSAPWTIVLELEPKDMIPITQAESPEVCAILLSKLPTSKAATLLGLMPGENARRVAYAMSKTTSVRPDAIARIGTGLAQHYCGASLPAFTDTAESRIGAILNSSPRSCAKSTPATSCARWHPPQKQAATLPQPRHSSLKTCRQGWPTICAKKWPKPEKSNYQTGKPRKRPSCPQSAPPLTPVQLY